MSGILDQYGRFAAKNPEVVVAGALIFTIIMGVFAAQLQIETNFDESLPQHLEPVRNDRIVSDTFIGEDQLLLLVSLNQESSGEFDLKDIRDARLMDGLYSLEQLLKENSAVEDVVGPPDVLIRATGTIPRDDQTIKTILSDSPLISPDFTAALLFVNVNTGADDAKVIRLVDDIREDIDSIGFPETVKISVTGGPLLQTTIFQLLLQDMVRTMSVAALLILFVLIIAYKSPVKGTITVTLLILAVLWTAGTMHVLGIPLSIVTVMVGAMIIGIGIDYIIHITNRYMEERKKKRTHASSSGIAVKTVGVAIIGTTITTGISFLSQAVSNIPFLTDMGIALTLGIFYAMIASLFVLPALLVAEEKFSVWMRSRIHDRTGA